VGEAARLRRPRQGQAVDEGGRSEDWPRVRESRSRELNRGLPIDMLRGAFRPPYCCGVSPLPCAAGLFASPLLGAAPDSPVLPLSLLGALAAGVSSAFTHLVAMTRYWSL